MWKRRPKYFDLSFISCFIFYVGRYFDEISQETGKYCFGVADTLKGLEMGCIEILIAWENLDIMRFVLKNAATTEGKILHLTPAQERDRSYFTDKETGVELELVESMPLLEWLANNYKSFGATLEIITDRSQEGSQFVKGFGGIGGKLCILIGWPELGLYLVLLVRLYLGQRKFILVLTQPSLVLYCF